MKKEWILIAVKTYPTLSEKYIELVCTACGRTTSTGTSRPGNASSAFGIVSGLDKPNITKSSINYLYNMGAKAVVCNPDLVQQRLHPGQCFAF